MKWAYPNYNSPHQCPKCLTIAYITKKGKFRGTSKKTVYKCENCQLRWRYRPKNRKTTDTSDFESRKH